MAFLKSGTGSAAHSSRSGYLYAVLASAAVIGALFILEAVMFRRAQDWAQRSTAIPLYERILFGIAVFWSQTWPVSAVVVLAVAVSLTSVVSVLHRHPPSSS